MASAADVIQIGPFSGGLNTYSDPTAVLDNELVMAENFELDLDGSLVSRPPFTSGPAFPLGATGNMSILGYYYDPTGTPFLIASDGLTSTYYFNGSSWTLITNTVSASAMTQYQDLAWLQAPLTSGNPGGSWSPSAGFTAVPAIPKGDVLIAHKSRLWASSGSNAGIGQNGTRIYLSSVADPKVWNGDFVTIGNGDGQNIVKLMIYFNDLLIFKKSSVYRFSYSTDPSTGQPSRLSQDIGLAGKDAAVNIEGVVYFAYDDRVYTLANYQLTQINQKVPLVASTTANNYLPTAVSQFNNRLIVSYYDTMYVYDLRIQRWVTWKSSQYGAIGRIVQLDGNSTVESAIAHSTVTVPSTVVSDTNYETNPRVTSLTGFTADASVTGPTLSLLTGVTAPSDAPTATNRVRATNTVTTNTYIGISKTYAVTAGTAYSIGAYITTTANAGNYVMYIIWKNGSGTQVGTVVQSTGVGGSTGFTRVKLENVIPPATATQALIIYRKVAISGNLLTGDTMDLLGLSVSQAATLSPYFDGNTVRDSSFSYAWNGAADGSTSTKSTVRSTNTLLITDGFSPNASENIVCTIQTKNYNYEAPSLFKRLFYWGVDAAFRGPLSAYASAIQVHGVANWDQLLPRTWGDMLAYNWDNPGVGDANVYLTQIDTSNSESMRKFVKLGRSFRFRQVYFRLVFNNDGTSTTAPARLFSIMTRVNTKQTVVDQVS